MEISFLVKKNTNLMTVYENEKFKCKIPFKIRKINYISFIEWEYNNEHYRKQLKD